MYEPDTHSDDNGSVYDLTGSTVSTPLEDDREISIEDTDDEEEIDEVICPSCMKETQVLDTMQCQICNVAFELDKNGFIKDGFVQDDDEEIEFDDESVDRHGPSSEDEFDFNEVDSESSEDIDNELLSDDADDDDDDDEEEEDDDDDDHGEGEDEINSTRRVGKLKVRFVENKQPSLGQRSLDRSVRKRRRM